MQLATWLLPTNILNQNLYIERSLFESFCVSNDVIHWLALLWCGCRPIMFATFHIDSIPFNQFRVNTMKQIAETSVSGLVVNLISNNKNIIWRLGLPCSISFCYFKGYVLHFIKSVAGCRLFSFGVWTLTKRSSFLQLF